MKHIPWITMPPPHTRGVLLRKYFDIEKLPSQVKCRIAGLGFYELYINGIRVGNARLDPTFTRYDVRTGYREYEVRQYLKKGRNLCEIHLGSGWYAGEYADVHGSNFASYRNVSKAALRIFSGQNTILQTSEDWESAPGPILKDSPRTGEHYDARLVTPEKWIPAKQVMPPGGKLFKLTSEPVTLQQPQKYVACRQEKEQVFCYDFGCNLTGTVKLEVKGSPGSKAVLRYGEICDEKGCFSQHNINWYLVKGEFQTDSYILRGDKNSECWTPSFSYHGFRYVQISIEGNAQIIDLQALPMRSNFALSGAISCSNKDFSHLLEVVERTLTSNFVGFPSDCPHREKNGWLADAHLAAESMLVWYDAAGHYSDFVDNIFDYQRPSGQLPGMIPGGGYGWHWDFGPLWTIAPILLAYYCYIYRGETAVISKHYRKMVKYLDFILDLRRNNIVNIGPGEWKMPEKAGTVNNAIIDTALIIRCFRHMELFAGLLNRPADKSRFDQQAADLSKNLQQLKPAHPVELAVLLCCKLGNKEYAAQLNDMIQKADFTANFGITGAKYIPRALAEYGYINTAYRMFTQHQYPGWQWMLDQGATTLWENWQGNESQNHPMLGDAAAWAVRYLGGIKPQEENPFDAELSPQYPDELDEFACQVKLASGGKLLCHWKRLNDKQIKLEFSVPERSCVKYIDPQGRSYDLKSGSYEYTADIF